jgi:O-antigen/teichoic acid export membrane protein
LTGSLSLNVVASTVGSVINALCGLAMAAYLLRQLGLESFGVWALVVSTTSLLGLLDLGTIVATGRLIAAQRANDDIEGVSRIFSTALAMLGGFAVVAAIAGWLVPHVFFWLFTVPAEDSGDVALALWIMVLTICAYFLASPFSCLLWGYERLDLIHLIDTPLVVLRLGLLVVLVGTGSPLWIVAACTLTTGCLAILAHAYASFRVEPRLVLRPRLVSRGTAGTIFRLGLDFAVLNGANSVAIQLPPIIIGFLLTNAATGIFAVARQLSVNCNTLVSAATVAIAARSVKLFHMDAGADQKTLFVEGGRYTAALSCMLAIGLLIFGDNFIHLWQGGRADEAAQHLRILMLGELIAMSQWVTFWVLAGIRKQRVLTIFSVSEIIAIVVLSHLLAPRFGLVGISIATAVAAAVFRGIGPFLLGCRLLEVSYRHYFSRVILPNALAGIVVASVSIGLDTWLDPRQWTTLILTGFLYSAVFVGGFAPFLLRSFLGGNKIKPFLWRA